MRLLTIFTLVVLLFHSGWMGLVDRIHSAAGEQQVVYVPDDYDTVQAAINNASNGSIVFVRGGIYYEHPVVNNSIKLIGEDPRATVLDGNGTDTVVMVTSDSVTVCNLTVQNGFHGILVVGADNVVISKNDVFHNREGITVRNSGNCTVSENNSTSNVNRGIFLSSCWNSIVSNNRAVNNTDQYGINANHSRNIALVENLAMDNFWDGIGLLNSTNCIVWKNIVSGNRIFGVWSDSSSGSVVYHNVIVNNTLNAKTTNSQISWNSSYPSGGNYWSDYVGNDTFRGQDQQQLGSDGIGDTPHLIELPNHQDWYPLVEPRSNGSAVFLASAKSVQTLGDDVLMYGTMWPKLAGANITIWYRQDNGNQWKALRSILTDSTGKYSFLWSNLTDGKFRVKATWSGNSETYGSQSSVTILEVQKIQSSISIATNQTEAHVGSTIKIEGKIVPPRAFVDIVIWHGLTNENWTMLTTTQTTDNSNYTFLWNPSTKGEFRLKSSWTGDDITQDAESHTTILTIKVLSALTINADKSKVIVGSNVTISGTVDPRRENISVTIKYRSENESWSNLATVQTDREGSYTFIWQTSRLGQFWLKATLTGDSDSFSAESSTLEVNVHSSSALQVALPIILVIVVVAILSSSMYLFKKKKRQ